MTTHKIGTREAWQAASAALLEREKEHTRMGDDFARQRRSLPWVPVEKEYTLQTGDGPRTLAQLFDGRSQLLLYHFMFGPSYEAGCPVNSSMADTFDSLIPHLSARDVTLIAVSGAPIEKLLAYRERMGWKFDWASKAGPARAYCSRLASPRRAFVGGCIGQISPRSAMLRMCRLGGARARQRLDRH